MVFLSGPDCCGAIVFGNIVHPFDEIDVFFRLPVDDDGDEDDFGCEAVGESVKLSSIFQSLKDAEEEKKT